MDQSYSDCESELEGGYVPAPPIIKNDNNKISGDKLSEENKRIHSDERPEEKLSYLTMNIQLIPIEDETMSTKPDLYENERPTTSRQAYLAATPSHSKSGNNLNPPPLAVFECPLDADRLNDTEYTLKTISKALESKPLPETTASQSQVDALKQRCGECIELVETIRVESRNPTLILSQLPLRSDETLRRLDRILYQDKNCCNKIARHLVPFTISHNVIIIIRLIMERIADYRIWNLYSVYHEPRTLDEVVDKNFVFTDRKGILELLYKTCLCRRNGQHIGDNELRIAFISFFKRRVLKRKRLEREDRQNNGMGRG